MKKNPHRNGHTQKYDSATTRRQVLTCWTCKEERSRHNWPDLISVRPGKATPRGQKGDWWLLGKRVQETAQGCLLTNVTKAFSYAVKTFTHILWKEYGLSISLAVWRDLGQVIWPKQKMPTEYVPKRIKQIFQSTLISCFLYLLWNPVLRKGEDRGEARTSVTGTTGLAPTLGDGKILPQRSQGTRARRPAQGRPAGWR